MKTKSISLKEAVQENRDNLKKQNEWAIKVSKKDFMSDIQIDEKQYGYGPREKLDIIYKKSLKDEKKPVLFYIHGGGWISGDKESRRVYCGKYADAGYVVVNIEYELAPEAVFPTAVGQCVKAADFICNIAEQYKMNMNQIGVGGESAGVYYAMFLCEISKDKMLCARFGIPEMQHKEFDVKAAMFNCGAIDFKRMAEKGFPGDDLMLRAYLGYSKEEVLSGQRDDEIQFQLPLNYMKADFPPTFLIYGNLDSLKYNTFMIDEKMNELGIPHKLYKSTGIFYGQHTTTMIFKSKKAFRVFDIIDTFLKDILTGRRMSNRLINRREKC